MSALQKMESFDNVDTTTFALKWLSSNGIIVPMAGTDNSKAFGLTSWSQRATIQAGGGEICIGFQFFARALPSSAKRILELRDSGNGIVAYLTLNAAGGLSVYDHNDVSVGATANAVISAGGFLFIEFGIDVNTGEFFIEVNEVNKLTSTASFTGNSVNFISLSSGFNSAEACEVFYDDFYVNGEFVALGIMKVACLFPTANGSITQWIPYTGNNFAQVQEATPDNSTTRVLAMNPVTDLYDVTAVPTGKTVYGVQLNQYLGKGASCNQAAQNVILADSITAVGGSVCITTDGYDFHISEMFSTYPPDGGEWTPERVNDAEFGSKKVSDCDC